MPKLQTLAQTYQKATKKQSHMTSKGVKTNETGDLAATQISLFFTPSKVNKSGSQIINCQKRDQTTKIY